jgi:hypothetical protein
MASLQTSNDRGAIMPVMPFGKFAGQRLAEVPFGYLLWCVEEMEALRPETRRLIERELADRVMVWPLVRQEIVAAYHQGYAHGQNAVQPAATSPKRVREVFHRLCLRHHPDRGGTVEAMAAINELYEAMTESAN